MLAKCAAKCGLIFRFFQRVFLDAGRGARFYAHIECKFMLESVFPCARFGGCLNWAKRNHTE